MVFWPCAKILHFPLFYQRKQLKSNFVRCNNCANEFLLHGKHISYDECAALCQAHSSEIFANIQKFEELHKTNFSTFDISTIWIQSTQEAVYGGYYDATHLLQIRMGDKLIALLPENNFSTGVEKKKRVLCFTFYVEGFKELNCANLPTKTRYYQRENEQNVYYGKNSIHCK